MSGSSQADLGALLPLALMLCSPVSEAAPDFELYARLAASVVKIEAHNPDGSTSIGSAVMVAPGKLVTSCHVTRNASSIEVVKSGLRWDAQKQQGDIAHDLCLLYVPSASAPVAQLGSGKLKVGQQVYAIGYVGGLGPRFSAGWVRALYDYDGGKVIQTTTPFRSGASGGGLFDEQGRLIGVVAFLSRLDQTYHFSLPVSWVVNSLAMNQAEDVAPLPEDGRAFWQESNERQPYFLQAAALEAAENWGDLLELAEKWSTAEKNNADSWLALGKAHYHMRRHDRAIAAYRQAIAVERDYPEAWYNLGLVYLDEHRQNELAEVRKTLAALDQELEKELAKAQPLR
ncbi:MAG TPA: trypsin-like peptidase domain-containing protein [Burkholderiales bacterium]|nr:trypsin-like peptidase domain-containing protein [Burkholderiales bacterium]